MHRYGNLYPPPGSGLPANHKKDQASWLPQANHVTRLRLLCDRIADLRSAKGARGAPIAATNCMQFGVQSISDHVNDAIRVRTYQSRTTSLTNLFSVKALARRNSVLFQGIITQSGKNMSNSPNIKCRAFCAGGTGLMDPDPNHLAIIHPQRQH